MSAKCGSVDDAWLILDTMEDRNVITWNMMSVALDDRKREQEAYELFLRMLREGYVPDAIICMSILNACASAGALEWTGRTLGGSKACVTICQLN